MTRKIRTLPVFPFEAPRRMNVMLEVLRHEPAMALLELLEYTKQTSLSLTKQLKRLTGQYIKTSKYLEEVLVPSSLVEKFDLGFSDQAMTYSLKKAARTHGVPAIDFTLDYSIAHDFWLGDVFGRRLLLDIKTCGRRYLILKSLYGAEKPLSKLTLQVETGSDWGAVSRDVADLVSLGLINSEALNVDSIGFHAVEWKGREFNLPGSQNRNARFVAGFLSRARRASLNEVVSGSGLHATQAIAGVYTLIENGLARPLEKFPIKKKYEISMTEKGKQHWEGYFVPLYEFLSDRKALPEQRNYMTRESSIQEAMDIFRDRTGN